MELKFWRDVFVMLRAGFTVVLVANGLRRFVKPINRRIGILGVALWDTERFFNLLFGHSVQSAVFPGGGCNDLVPFAQRHGSWAGFGLFSVNVLHFVLH